jgi:hypothetical protein
VTIFEQGKHIKKVNLKKMNLEAPSEVVGGDGNGSRQANNHQGLWQCCDNGVVAPATQVDR